MDLTPTQIAYACHCSLPVATDWRPHLLGAMNRYAIDTPARAAAFLPQIAHESGRLQLVRELWGPTPAQRGYEGRADLGNTHPGDGSRYRGRGLIQITGRANYARARENLRKAFGPAVPDFEVHPETLEQPQWAAASAAEFWSRNGLNVLADAGQFDRITRRINGGMNGAESRRILWASAKSAIPGPARA